MRVSRRGARPRRRLRGRGRGRGVFVSEKKRKKLFGRNRQESGSREPKAPGLAEPTRRARRFAPAPTRGDATKTTAAAVAAASTSGWSRCGARRVPRGLLRAVALATSARTSRPDTRRNLAWRRPQASAPPLESRCAWGGGAGASRRWRFRTRVRSGDAAEGHSPLAALASAAGAPPPLDVYDVEAHPDGRARPGGPAAPAALIEQPRGWRNRRRARLFVRDPPGRRCYRGGARRRRRRRRPPGGSRTRDGAGRAWRACPRRS